MTSSKLLRPALMILIAVFAAASLFTLFTSFAAGGDPAIPDVMITAVPPIHQVGDDIYFNNSSTGHITAAVSISGTAPLTFTTAPAFDRPGELFTYTTSPALAVLPYTIATNIGSQLGITYTVVNSLGVSTAEVNYIRDVTAPTTVMTTSYGIITSAMTSPLLLAGTVSDAGSGVDQVEINPAGAGYVNATLGSTGNHITQTTWSHNWNIPSANRIGYTFLYRGVDNLGATEVAHTQVITVDNVAPAVLTPTITVQGVHLHITWPASTASDFGRYELTVRRGNGTVVATSSQTGTSYNYNGTVGETYYAQLRVRDNVGNQSAIGTSSTVQAGAFVFMPLLINPYPAPQGTLQFDSGRFAGVTSFVSPVTVELSGITFPGAPLPTQMRIWRSDQSPGNWIPYAATHNLALSSVIGAQTVYAQFQWAGGSASSTVQGTVFYIPNGDFVQGVSALTNWQLDPNGLPYSISGGKLILGNPNYGCNNIPIGDARAGFNLNIPANSNYRLRVNATVYTYDQLPNPSQGVYDAFEVHIGSSVTRFGNPVAPISCSTLRTVQITTPFSLQGYSGSTSVSLRNVTRFDEWFNTYTEIEQVWVDTP